MKRKKIEFSSHTGNLGLMRDHVRKFLDSYPLSQRERMLMVLGVDEACTNIIRYAYELRDDQLIVLSMEGLRNCVRMRLRDYGKKTPVHEMKGRAHDAIKIGWPQWPDPSAVRARRAPFPWHFARGRR